MQRRRREIPHRPDRDYAIRRAREFIFESNINRLPIDPFAIYEQHGWHLFTWKEARQILGDPDPLLLKKYGAEARTSIPRGSSEVLTVYDSSITPKTRIRWTLAHEIGHIELGHLYNHQETALSRSGLTHSKHKVLEDEAHLFAAEFLAPIAMVRITGCRSPVDIMKLFKISQQAAANRLKDLLWWGSKPIAIEADAAFEQQFDTYLITHKIRSTTKG